MQTVTRQFTIRYFLFMQSVKGQNFVAIFYRISAWLDHWFSSGFTGIEILKVLYHRQCQYTQANEYHFDGANSIETTNH